MDDLESRVTDLEIQITYQNKTLEELNTIIIDQRNDVIHEGNECNLSLIHI